MVPHFSLLSPSFFCILLLNVDTVTDRTFIYLACTHHFSHLVSVHCWLTRVSPRAHVAKFYVRFQLIRSVLRASKFSGVKFIEFIILWIYHMASLLASASFLVIFDISVLNYLVWLRITDEGSVPEVHIWSILLMKSNLKCCIHLDLFILQPLHSLGECHCWWTRESLRAHSAKFPRSTSVDS